MSDENKTQSKKIKNEKESEESGSGSDDKFDTDSEEESESSNECNCDMSHSSEEEEDTYAKQVNHTETSIMRRKPDAKFYEKQLISKKEQEKKYELIRKKREEDLINMAKPKIDEQSKKIMEKKQGFVKPIFQRAKEIEETKKSKIENIKKGIEEKKAKKEEEELLKSKFLIKNKHFNQKEFEEWRKQQVQWETEKQKKIKEIKEKQQKSQLESLSKFYRPVIDKRSENIVNKTKKEYKNVFEKLYNHNEEKQKRLLQKTIETLPDFRPDINKKLPTYIRNRPVSSQMNYSTAEYYSSDSRVFPKTQTNSQTKKPRFAHSIEALSSNGKTTAAERINLTVNNINVNNFHSNNLTNNFNTINTMSEKTSKSRAMNSSTIETYNNPIILSNSEDENEEENCEKDSGKNEEKSENTTEKTIEKTIEKDDHMEVVSKYKKALENANKTPNAVKRSQETKLTDVSIHSKNTNFFGENSKMTVNKVIPKPRLIPAVSTVYSSDKNKEKIEMYNQKIAALLSCLKKTEKKKF